MAITLKAARVNAGFTQNEAAKLLNISRSALQSYEKYRTIPNIELSKHIATLYKINVDSIIFFKQ